MRSRRRDRTREPADRERRALEIHDNLVQGLTAIHWALEAGAYEQAKDATRSTLAQAQAIIGDLLGDDPAAHAFAPGSLRRESAAATAHKP